MTCTLSNWPTEKHRFKMILIPMLFYFRKAKRKTLKDAIEGAETNYGE